MKPRGVGKGGGYDKEMSERGKRWKPVLTVAPVR